MSTSTADYMEMKSAQKEALVELCQERRELFHDLIQEALAETGFIESPSPARVPHPKTSSDNDFEKVVVRPENNR